MVVVFSVLRTLLPGDTIRFEGTKAEAEETTIATTARTSGENLFILFTLFVVKYLKNY